jgi:hypothetical protein
MYGKYDLVVIGSGPPAKRGLPRPPISARE